MTQNELIIELNNLTANWLQDVDENCAQHLTTDRLLIPIIDTDYCLYNPRDNNEDRSFNKKGFECRN